MKNDFLIPEPGHICAPMILYRCNTELRTGKFCYLTQKVQERRMRWYGHVMRRDEEYVGKRAMGIEAQGSRRGRPKVGGLSGEGSCMEATIVPHRPDIEVG